MHPMDSIKWEVFDFPIFQKEFVENIILELFVSSVRLCAGVSFRPFLFALFCLSVCLSACLSACFLYLFCLFVCLLVSSVLLYFVFSTGSAINVFSSYVVDHAVAVVAIIFVFWYLN